MYLKILSPLRHSGEHYKPGDVVEMDGKQAAILIADGIAEKTAKPMSAKPTKPSKAEEPSSDSAASSGNDQAPGDESSSDSAASSGNDQEPGDEEQNSAEDDAASAE